MTKLLKIAATTLLYSGLFVVALNAVFQMDMPSIGAFAAQSMFTGFIHGVIWP